MLAAFIAATALTEANSCFCFSINFAVVISGTGCPTTVGNTGLMKPLDSDATKVAVTVDP